MTIQVPEHLTLIEYQRRYDDLDDVDEYVDCPECGGTGDEECFHCGSEIECETCDGEGQVLEYTTAHQFKALIKVEEERWIRWCESMGGTDARAA